VISWFRYVGFVGGGLVLLSPENTQEHCMGHIGRDIICLLQAGMCDVVKHERQKLEVPEHMVHIMAPATNQMKCAAYDGAALAVASLTEIQYVELTQEQHPVNEWNRILLAIQAGSLSMHWSRKRSISGPLFHAKQEGEVCNGGLHQEIARCGPRGPERYKDPAETAPAGI
jgi:hypothetical protein